MTNLPSATEPVKGRPGVLADLPAQHAGEGRRGEVGDEGDGAQREQAHCGAAL